MTENAFRALRKTASAKWPYLVEEIGMGAEYRHSRNHTFEDVKEDFKERKDFALDHMVARMQHTASHPLVIEPCYTTHYLQ